MAHTHAQVVEESGSLSPQSQARDVVQEDTTPHVRPVQIADLPQIVQIEARAFGDPWTSEAFEACLQAGICCWVLEHPGRIDAYGIMALGAGTAHILNLCVRTESQRRGLGRQMLAHLLALARRRQASMALLEVRASNRAAIGLYTAMDFRTIGVRKAYYRTAQDHEDALVMARPV